MQLLIDVNLLKAHIKAHTRRLSTGKIIEVRAHERRDTLYDKGRGLQLPFSAPIGKLKKPSTGKRFGWPSKQSSANGGTYPSIFDWIEAKKKADEAKKLQQIEPTKEDRIEVFKEFGKEWKTSSGRHRIYLNNLPDFFGLKFVDSPEGKFATVDGQKIDNKEARIHLRSLTDGKYYYDYEDGKFHTQGLTAEEASKIKDKTIELAKKKALQRSGIKKQPISGKSSPLVNLSVGEGYGGRPFRVGEVLRNPKNRDQILIVTSVKQKYFHEDGLSFGVGDDSGHIFYATAREATPEESTPFLEKEKSLRERRALEKRRIEIEAHIKQNGELPNAPHPEGEKFSDRHTIYGGGDSFVVGKDYIWYIKGNGGDGDDWSVNNLPGAIAWRIPFDPEMAKELEKINRLPKSR